MAYAVITRAGSAEYAVALAPLGLQLVEMQVTYAEDLAYTIAIEPDLIAVASARAIAAVRSVVTAATGDPEVWVIGAATQRAFVEAGVSSHVPDGVVDGASLADAIVRERSVAGKRVLVPRALDGRPELADRLRAAGAIVDDVAVYRTVPVPPDHPGLAHGKQLIRAGEADVIIALAPSQVRALATLFRPLPRAHFVAIGETTAAALRDEGVTPIVAATPTPAGIATALAAVYPRRT
ncbi:MAG TPA: uroporphyrinogen-III synthase [Kofleriaceae bacterium]|jgi:uroporphyrinogen-III synthase